LSLQNVFFKISESEHSDSEFYYPCELSDAKMLQLPTHSEAAERKALLTNEEIEKFITDQQQANTVKKTTYGIFQRFLIECGEKQDVVEIPPEELDSLLCNFYINAKKKDNSQYQHDTMSSFSRSIQRIWMTTTQRGSFLWTKNSRYREES